MALSGKRALVTGGARGIGAGIARRFAVDFAVDGADVAITYASNADAAQGVVGEIAGAGRKGFAFKADSGDRAAQRAAVAEAARALGGIDILVQNAGVFVMAPAGGDNVDTYARAMAVNVDGVFHGTEAAIPHLSDGGRIIVISSVNAHSSPRRGWPSMARPRRR